MGLIASPDVLEEGIEIYLGLLKVFFGRIMNFLFSDILWKWYRNNTDAESGRVKSVSTPHYKTLNTIYNIKTIWQIYIY